MADGSQNRVVVGRADFFDPNNQWECRVGVEPDGGRSSVVKHAQRQRSGAGAVAGV